MSKTSTKKIASEKNTKAKNAASTEEKRQKLEKAAELRKKAGKGSLSAAANMVEKFNSNDMDK